jgi:polyhydroxyalkanoate synthesis regulator phasin
MKKQGYGAAEIAQAIEKASFPIPDKELQQPVYTDIPEFAAGPSEDYFASQQDSDFDDDLTDEDRTYLRLKWGKTYKPEEWIRLEQLYNEMMDSYDIQSAGHIDTLKLICKTSLKANQLIDIGDIEGFQKMSKVYDALMKSGKFTAAQNKAESGEYVDSISELVELCEKQGYIERFYIDEPNDKVDETIKDMQRYTKTLIERETNLSALIEQAVK